MHQRTLAVHTKFVHNNEEVSCGQCEAKFSNRSSLIYHTNVKHKGRTFQCNACPDRLTTKVNLTQHIKVKHQNNTSKEHIFACDLCVWKTDSQAKLETHVKQSHRPKKSIMCKLCNKVLANSRSLSAHVKNHSKTGTAFHKCLFCSFYIGDKKQLKRHSKNVHGDSK